MICHACRHRFHALCTGCPCQHRVPKDSAAELAAGLRRAARQKVQDGEPMTVEQAQAWLANVGLCACIGGKACCHNVTTAAKAVLSSATVGGDTPGLDAG
jgi:hypothetical protein